MKLFKIGAIFLICFLAANASFAQRHSLGLRLGDPLGFSYKYYVGDGSALELIIGRTSGSTQANYYRNAFLDDPRFDDFSYQGHNVVSSSSMQGRYVFHQDLYEQTDLEGLSWYYGFGGQVRFINVDYLYENLTEPLPNQTRETITNIDMGIESILGLGYEIPTAPVTLYFETSLFLEIIDRFGPMRFQAAVGARYIF
ncbi:hypothetical protein [Penaeicola halotolerans]|uniref:hypothetical protein n=1 Tax=Penaeicola halotolerans TaxID=2793196 RepID=UPI001CF87F17|nr:hypothetical protein [Penaeicola halotolerans]